MTLTVRQVFDSEADDVAPALARLIGQLSSSEAGPDLKAIAGRLRDERVHVFVAEVDNKIVGTATLSVAVTLWKGAVGHVDDVVVDPAAQGRGVGRQLMESVHAAAGRLGLAHLELTSRASREAANALYQSLGYERRETNVYRLRLPTNR